MEKSSLKELKDAWKMNIEQKNIDIFESELDMKVLKSNLKLSYFFQTHLLPQPFWGNIANPKIVVLGLNPSYDPVNDEQDEFELMGDLVKNLNDYDFSFNWFNHKKNNSELTSGFKFWSETLGEFHHGSKDPNCVEQSIFENVGFFNLYGYHKSPFKEIQQKCFRPTYKGKYLPTQKALFTHLKTIISKDTYVIVIWGYQYWKDTGVLSEVYIDTSKLLIVNRNKGNNHIITNVHKYKYQDKPYKDFSSSLINSSSKASDIKNVYCNFYNKILGVIRGT
jgi:hypothetical protein